MAIIISKSGKNAQKIHKSNFEKEDYLQKYIYDNPESIPLYDIKEDIRLLIVIREFSTESGYIDAIGIDIYGNIYLIETKLYKNPDKRLVVAQVLDYGASLWRHFNDFSEFLRIIDEEVNRKFEVSLSQKSKDFFQIGDEEVSLLLENVKKNLNDGKFRFVVLMDKLHDQLKDLIIFINENSEFDIYAVEMEYYKYDDYEIMIPKLFGSEVKKNVGVVTSSSARRKWDEKTFFDDAAQRLNKDELEAVKKLYEFSKSNADTINWGTGITKASFSPIFSKTGAEKSLFTIRSNGILSLNFGWLNDDENATKCREEFKEMLTKRKVLSIPENYKTHFPEYQADNWRKKTDELIEVVKNLFKN